MQKAPLVSVVIITYNQEKYIAQTLDAVLAQETEYEYEIVIGEDCSTDRTREIVYQYQQQCPDKIRVITSDKNVGLLDNYFRTVKVARGKYVAVCGGDDYWHSPEKLQKQVKFLEENIEYGMVHSEADFFLQKSGSIIKNYHSFQKHCYGNISKSTACLIVQGKYPITACTAIYRKRLFDQYFKIDEFKQNGFLMEDTPLWTGIAAHSKIHYMPESLATYRVLDESVSRSKDRKKTLQFGISSAEMRLYLCEKHRLPEHIKKLQEKNWRNKSLQLAFIERRRDLAELVRQRSSAFSIKDWFWYQGTQIPLMRPVVLLLQKLFQRGQKK
jgi:glycosyltransferase involved in cell wall biosynthesis